MKIGITGATGFVGKRLISTLLKRGHSIVAFGRSPEKILSIYRGEKVEAVAWDALASSPKPLELPALDALVHLAGEPVFGFRWSEEKKRKIRETRVNGTKNLGVALGSLKPKTFISTSAIGFYGSRDAEVLTEKSSKGEGFLALVCEDWEKEALKIEAGRTCIFRIGIVLGENGGALSAMLTPFNAGVGGKLGSGKQWMSWIHIDDLVSMMVTALENDRWQGIVNAVSPNPVTNADFTKTLGHVLHRPTLIPVPEFALKIALGEMAHETVLASQNVLPRRAEELGYSFQFKDLEGALKNIMA